MSLYKSESRGGSYIDSPDWIENKKATINSINKEDDKCFQHASTVVLSQKEKGNHSEIIRKIKPFINNHN